MRNPSFIFFTILIGGMSVLTGSIYCVNPIIILNADKCFGEYTGEILKTEGFNEFEIINFNENINVDDLRLADVVILPEMPLSDHQVAVITNFVRRGGNLIAFRPVKELCHLFGMVDAGSTLREGYINIDADKAVNQGLIGQSLQYHGVADQYRVTTGEKMAELLHPDQHRSGAPALVYHRIGQGQAFAFTYNLPRSVALTRQGNPNLAGLEKDGIIGLRSMDLFTGGWVDTSKNIFNQADEQMRLLSHCIDYLTLSRKPLPRLWYFPDTLKCLVVLDNDGEDSFESEFGPQFRVVDSMGAKMTLYLKDIEKVSREWVEAWTAKGFEMAAHPDDTKEAANPTWSRMDSVLLDIKNRFKQKYGMTIRTNVNHWFVWCGKDSLDSPDFVAEAKLEAMHGIEMDANYAHYDNGSDQGLFYLGTPGTSQGNFTGTGMVMKYVDVEGKLVDVYQRFNAIYDQQYMENKDPDGFYRAFKGLVDRSLNDEVYSFVSIKCHNNEYFFSKAPMIKMLDYANKKRVPVWTAVQLLDFLKMKDQATFSNIEWTNNQLSFRLNSNRSHEHGLTFMIPAVYLDRTIHNISVNGQDKPFAIKMVKGIAFAMLTVVPGENYFIRANY